MTHPAFPSTSVPFAPATEVDDRVRRARDLFEFLIALQRHKTKPVRMVSAYANQPDGHVTWWEQIPTHPSAVQILPESTGETIPLLIVDRLGDIPPPAPPKPLAGRIGEHADPSREPELAPPSGGSISTDPIATDANPTDADSTDPIATDPIATDPIATDADPTDSNPTDSNLTDSNLTDSNLTDSNPTDPIPTDPIPTDPISPEPDQLLFDAWLEEWRAWAEAAQTARKVRDFYKSLYATMLTSKTRSEEVEVVLGLGCVSWRTSDNDPIQRHALSVPTHIEYDDVSGRLTVSVDDAAVPLVLEVEEFVEPGQIAVAETLAQLKAEVEAYAGSPVDRGPIEELLTRLSNSIRHDALYAPEATAFPPSSVPRIAWAPALITRKRTTTGLVQIFETIAARIAETGMVPAGLMPLIDPNYQPPSEPDRTPGAAVRVGGEVLVPLPLNGKQLQVLERIDSTAQTVVQGPPGTGKTHTIAAVLSHLLAQGKRVLVTAHTDRALEEVRAKLPDPIQALSVSVIGTSREDMSDLKLAVETIASRSEQHDPEHLATSIRRHEKEIDHLREARAAAHRELVDARELEVKRWTVGGRSGTLAELTKAHEAMEESFGWLSTILASEGTSATSRATPRDATNQDALTNDEALEWLRLTRDEVLKREEEAAAQRLIDAGLPDADSFAAMCHAEAQARQTIDHMNTPEVAYWTEALGGRPEAELAPLRAALETLVTGHDSARATPSPWADRAIGDILSGQHRLWSEKHSQLTEIGATAAQAVEEVGAATEVRITQSQTVVEPLATALHQHLLTAGDLRTRPDGMPKVGLFSPRVVKAAQPLFTGVQVNGLPPTTRQSVGQVLAHLRAERVLRLMDIEWQDLAAVPPDSRSAARRLRWHQGELELLGRVANLVNQLTWVTTLLRELQIPEPDWQDMAGPRDLLAALEVVPVNVALELTCSRLADIANNLTQTAAWDDASPCVAQARVAVIRRDPSAYSEALARSATLQQIAVALDRRSRLRNKLSRISPGLPATIEASVEDPRWESRLAALDAATDWAGIEDWLNGHSGDDIKAVQQRLEVIDDSLNSTIGNLAAARAWEHALSEGRIDQRMRLDLHTYVQAVRRLGKGTGKYAAVRRAEIREAMNRCRTAIPVWIMPLYRIAEQLRPEENSFDVVIVDEASQASVDAVFLQYFAPKLVVVGDDRQVSPAGVGVDQQELRDLAHRHMPDNPYRNTSWSDPERSLFDEATARYRGKITLTEHRRCVPEIIGFSNEIAYEPDGVKLDPVRQVGSDRLPPIRTVFVPNAYRRRNVNQHEVMAIVEQVEACIADPAYAGKTMGIISLVGAEQARVIEEQLLERLPMEEFSSRQIRCGDATAFQGSERDVMFLSLVTTMEPDKRIIALTARSAMQRFNVAASRAKDQMWLFHSVRLDDLKNADDLRHKLLRYCLTTAERSRAGSRIPELVPDDVIVPPFDSLFEQRVFNQLARRGYDIRPQVEALGYRIDLVVRGGSRQIAIECDGDHWHGPEAYERDLARQRDLERCDWQFLRVRESSFYRDVQGEIEHLVTQLTDRGITPVDLAALPEETPTATTWTGGTDPDTKSQPQIQSED